MRPKRRRRKPISVAGDNLLDVPRVGGERGRRLSETAIVVTTTRRNTRITLMSETAVTETVMTEVCPPVEKVAVAAITGDDDAASTLR